MRSDPITPDHINDVALELLMLAIQFDGEYDGWSCEVLTSVNTPPKWSVREVSKEEESDSGDLN
jgi:hypothetical protein